MNKKTHKIDSINEWYSIPLLKNIEHESFTLLSNRVKLSCEEDENNAARWFENNKIGISILVESNIIVSIQLFSNDHPDFDQWNFGLPLDLEFGMNVNEIRDKLGEPDKSISKRSMGSGLSHEGIDRYNGTYISLVLTYSENHELNVLSFEKSSS